MIVQNRIEVYEHTSHTAALDKLREKLTEDWADWEPVGKVSLSQRRKPYLAWVARVTVQQEMTL